MRGATFWERLRRVDPFIWDGALALVVLAASIGGVILGPPASSDAGRTVVDRVSPGLDVIALLLLGCAPLAFRRRRPGLVLTVVGAASAFLAIHAGGADLALALAVASFTAAAHTDRQGFQRRVLPIALMSAAVSFTFAYARTNWVEVLISSTFTVGLPMIFGRVGSNRRRRIAIDRERAAHDAVTAERARIARDLHDVVAHAISVRVVQAGAARSVVDRDPAAAKVAIARIEETGRAGMTEMRRLIGILKDRDHDAALTPSPGLAQLGGLLATIRDAGVPVEAVTRGEPRPVSPSVELTAYRIVQEALTNVVKHAGSASAVVEMRWGTGTLELRIADDGTGQVPAEGSSPDGVLGHGLIGMRERLTVFGGTLETGRRPGGGFVVRARLPLEGDAAS